MLGLYFINDLHYDNRNDDENNRRAISLQNLKQMWKKWLKNLDNLI